MIFVNVHEGLLKDGSSLTSYVFEANLWSNSEDWESSCFMPLTLEKIWRNDRVLRASWCTRVLIASLCTVALRILPLTGFCCDGCVLGTFPNCAGHSCRGCFGFLRDAQGWTTVPGKNKIRDCKTGTGGEIAGAKPIGEQWGNPYLGLVARLYSHLRSPNQSENLFQLPLNSSSRIREANSL